MTRRDTILIAVLINAGLLIILFASALTSNSAPVEVAVAPALRTIESSVKKEVSLNGGDELDRVLTAAPSVLPQQPPLSLSAMPPSVPQSMSFVDDLKTLTSASSHPPFPSPITTPSHAQEKKSDDVVEVKVKKGDVLEKIARVHHTSVDEIISYNNLPSTHLRINQTLKIPKKRAQAEVKSVAQPIAVAESKYYVVKTGDNPWTIAVKNHMKVEDLLKLNNLDQEKARKLKPGDKLKIE